MLFTCYPQLIHTRISHDLQNHPLFRAIPILYVMLTSVHHRHSVKNRSPPLTYLLLVGSKAILPAVKWDYPTLLQYGNNDNLT